MFLSVPSVCIQVSRREKPRSGMKLLFYSGRFSFRAQMQILCALQKPQASADEVGKKSRTSIRCRIGYR
jgi:hypothetical protein